MNNPLQDEGSALAPNLAAPQQRPRPLPLFLQMAREQTAGDVTRLARVLEGLRAYQLAERPALPELPPAIAERKGARLRDYGGSGPPVLFVPSLINPPNILDLSEEKSLLRWLAGRGHRVLLLDWGADVEQRKDMSVAAHVSEIIVPMIGELDEPVALVGYCLGGTMALAAAALAHVRGLAAIASPWHFSGFPEDARAMLDRLWNGFEPMSRTLGVLPMEVLQSAFWSLDPGRTIAKFEAFAAMEPESLEARSFVTLEDWANDGPPLGEAAARELFEDFFSEDLPGTGRWIVSGQAIAPERLPCPLLNIVSTTDRIVPHASASCAGERLEIARGHVGMVVGSGSREALWEPLCAWLSRTAASC